MKKYLFTLNLCSFALFANTANAQIPSDLEWPLSGLPDNYAVSSDFGAHWQNSYCSGRKQLHTGLDLYNNAVGGSPVYAVWSGKVEVVVTYAAKYQNFVTISHGTSSNPWTAAYHHIIPIVNAGDSIKKGQQIGTVVKDNPNGAHLHIGIRDRTYSNTANRGRLPKGTTSCGGDPAFPNYFVNPANLDWRWRW